PLTPRTPMMTTTSPKKNTRPRLTLAADTAADLMTPTPVSIRDVAAVQEAVRLLTDKGISAAPVIDEAGRPVGVLSRADVIVHDREKVEYLAPVAEEHACDKLRSGYQVVNVDQTRVCEI